MNRPWVFNHVIVRAYGVVDLVEAVLRIVMGVKSPPLGLRVRAWSVRRSRR